MGNLISQKLAFERLVNYIPFAGLVYAVDNAAPMESIMAESNPVEGAFYE